MYQNGDTMMAVGCANKGDRIIFEVQSECVIKEFECVINLNIIVKKVFITINFTRKKDFDMRVLNRSIILEA